MAFFRAYTEAKNPPTVFAEVVFHDPTGDSSEISEWGMILESNASEQHRGPGFCR